VFEASSEEGDLSFSPCYSGKLVVRPGRCGYCIAGRLELLEVLKFHSTRWLMCGSLLRPATVI
jgi:hypothetical protein